MVQWKKTKWKKLASIQLKDEEVKDIKINDIKVCPIRKAFVEEIDERIKRNIFIDNANNLVHNSIINSRKVYRT